MSGHRPLGMAASRIRREEKWLLAALERTGHPVVRIDTRASAMPGRGFPGSEAVVLNREIGSVGACYLAWSLEAAGVTVVNDAAATEVCADKWRTALALRSAGVPVPRTVLAPNVDAARAAIEEFGLPVVVKPARGSWGRRVAYLTDRHAAEAVLDHCAALPAPQARVLCVQEPIDKPGRDIRVFVIGGRAVGAMYRRSAGWRTNVSLGAQVSPCPLDEDLAKLAVRAAEATGAEIAGVDLIEGTAGERYVLEVNARAEFAGLAGACGLDVAGLIAGYLKARAAA